MERTSSYWSTNDRWLGLGPVIQVRLNLVLVNKDIQWKILLIVVIVIIIIITTAQETHG